MSRHPENTHPSPARRTPSAIDAAAERHFRAVVELNPDFATELGLAGRETEYADLSPAGIEAQAQAARAALAEVGKLEPADDVDRVTVAAMRERLGLALDIHETGLDLGSLNNIASPAQGIRAIFDLMPTETAEHWTHIAGRMANVPGALAGYMESLRAAAARSRVSARRQVSTVVEQAAKYAQDGGFFDELAARGATTAPERADELERGARLAKEAYRGLADFLEDELLPQAPEKDAVGREVYALSSRDSLGAAVDLEESYQWGWEELQRIVAEQETVAARIVPGGGIEAATAALDADPKRTLQGTEALKAWMQELSDQAVAELAGTHFSIPDELRTLECLIAPTKEGGIYYTGPSEDFSRPGRMWWSVPEGEDTFQTWKETTTVYHEGVPGHHLQIGMATYSKDLLNSWRRNCCWTSGYGEGWALYAERLMQELGYLDDPGDHLGMLAMQRMRAARVVFDIGVHLELDAPEEFGGGTWTPEKGYELLTRHLPVSQGQRDFEFVRYLGWPGQAPSYKLGQKLWEEIRDERRRRAGSAFDVKAFHQEALELGSLGLDTLREALLGPGS